MSQRDESGSVTVHVARPTPVTDPLELKAIAMREYREKARLAGRPVSEAALERFVMQELGLVDAFGRWSRSRPPAPAAPDRKAERRASVQRKAAEQGVRIIERPGHYEVHAATRRGGSVTEKLQAATARIGRILENDGGTKVADVDRALAATAVPKLAREYLELWFHYQVRHRQSRFNPFAGLSDADASRKFLRGVIDICDKSTGVLGSWWVK